MDDSFTAHLAAKMFQRIPAMAASRTAASRLKLAGTCPWEARRDVVDRATGQRLPGKNHRVATRLPNRSSFACRFSKSASVCQSRTAVNAARASSRIRMSSQAGRWCSVVPDQVEPLRHLAYAPSSSGGSAIACSRARFRHSHSSDEVRRAEDACFRDGRWRG